MNISTCGEISTFLLSMELPNGSYIYLDQEDHRMYSTNPLEVLFKASLEYAVEIFKQVVHQISVASNLLPGAIKPIGLFKLVGSEPTMVDSVVLNSDNTAIYRTNQSFKTESLFDCTKDKIQPAVEYAEFESNGYLDED